MVGDIVNGKRHPGVGPIDGARRRIHEVLDAVVPTSLQDVQRAGDIAVDVRLWRLQGVPDTRLSREMHYTREPLPGKQFGDARGVREIEVLETEVR